LTTSSMRRSVTTTGGAGVIAACVAFLPMWEGMDKTARRDAIGTGHPITYCYGQTSEFGDVRVGTTFTKAECDAKLAASLPKYLDQLDRCIRVDMPDKTKAALLDGAYNAGSAAVCRSPMVAKMNAGDLEAGCNAFDGWYVRSAGVVRAGLIDRRAGEEHGDHRKSERGLCLEGLREANVVVPVKTTTSVQEAVKPQETVCKCDTPVVVPLPRSFPAAKKTNRLVCTTAWDVIAGKNRRACR
jgi:lysozyme